MREPQRAPAPIADPSTTQQRTMAFVLGLRGRGIADLGVVRALETVPRELFVPHRYVDLAWRDVALPIGCGQTMPEPYLLARMIEALDVAPGHSVLEIGSGSGYATAVLARLAERILSLERFRSLALEAAKRLEELGILNAAVVWGDGLDVPPEAGLFDRIIIHGVINAMPPRLTEALTESGIIVFAKHTEAGQKLVRLRHEDGGFVEIEIGASRLSPLIPGLSRAL